MLHKHLKELRVKRNMSIRKLSVISGVSKSYLSKIEKGDVKQISLAVAYKLGRTLNTRPCIFENSNHSCLYFILPEEWRKRSKMIEIKFLTILKKDKKTVNLFMGKFIDLLDEFVEK